MNIATGTTSTISMNMTPAFHRVSRTRTGISTLPYPTDTLTILTCTIGTVTGPHTELRGRNRKRSRSEGCDRR